MNVIGVEFPPTDLEYLTTLVNGITGPGLLRRRVQYQFDFLTPYDPRLVLGMSNTVIIPLRHDENDDDDGDDGDDVDEKYNGVNVRLGRLGHRCGF